MAIPVSYPTPEDQRAALVDLEVANDHAATTATSAPQGPLPAIGQAITATPAGATGGSGLPTASGAINPASGFPTSAPAAPPGASGLPTAPAAGINTASGFPTPDGPPAPPQALKEITVTPGPPGEITAKQLPEGVPPPPPGTTSYKYSGSVPAPGYAQHLKDYEASVAQGDLLGDSMNAMQVADMAAAAKEKDAAVSEGERRSAEFDKQYEVAQQRMQGLREKRDGLIDQLSRYELDPDKYFKSQSAMSSFTTGIGLMVGGMMQGGGYTTDNPALTQLNKAVDRQIDADKLQLSTRLKQLDYVTDAQKQEILDSTEMRLMQGVRREQYWDMVGRRMDAEAAKRGIDMKSQGYEIGKNMIDQQRKAAKLQNDRLAIKASMDAAAAARRHEEELNKWALEYAHKIGVASGDTTNIPVTGVNARAFVKGQAPVALDENGKPVLLPMTQVVKGGTSDLMEKHPETALKVEGSIMGYGAALVAYDKLKKLNEKTIAGVSLSPADAIQRKQLTEQIAILTKQENEGSEADKQARMVAFTPDPWADEKTLANQRAALEARQRSKLPGPAYVKRAQELHERFQKSQVE